jgi:hypothetical protein
MTWENYGAHWEYDHVRPCASFSLEDPFQQKACFSWQNTRPMSCTGNRRKNNTPLPQPELEAFDQLASAWLAAHPTTFSNTHGNNLKD